MGKKWDCKWGLEQFSWNHLASLDWGGFLLWV